MDRITTINFILIILIALAALSVQWYVFACGEGLIDWLLEHPDAGVGRKVDGIPWREATIQSVNRLVR